MKDTQHINNERVAQINQRFDPLEETKQSPKPKMMSNAETQKKTPSGLPQQADRPQNNDKARSRTKQDIQLIYRLEMMENNNDQEEKTKFSPRQRPI